MKCVFLLGYYFLSASIKMMIALTNLGDITYYEIVELRHIDENGRTRRDVSTFNPEENKHLEKTSFTFYGHGRHFHLRVNKNTMLIPDSFSNVYHNPEGSHYFHETVVNCYYHGYLVGRRKSSAAVNTCYGLTGVIQDDDDQEFIIEPHPVNNSKNINNNTTPDRYVLFKSNDVINKEINSGCGVTEAHHHVMENATRSDKRTASKHRITRRSIIDETKYVEVVVVLDHSMFRAHDESFEKTQHRALEVFNIVDSKYKSINTRVAVVNMVFWNIFNMVSVTESYRDTLRVFSQYTRQVLRHEMRLAFDNAQLITTQNWGSVVGFAGVGVICNPDSSAVNRDRPNIPAVYTACIISHELGHNIGFTHNTYPQCTCRATPCVMNSVASTRCQSFTNCSQNRYTSRLTDNLLYCLFDFPGSFYGKPRCGNGFVEKGEHCDCGTEEECKKINADRCCNYTTCTLHEIAQCATGPCCENCRFKRRGVMCRPKMSADCDLEEFCTGRSGNCPKNFYLQDGTTCKKGTAYCYEGTCKTHTMQCRTLFGSNGEKLIKAPDSCYSQRNSIGDQWGHCGVDDRGDYIRCKAEDVLCGRIQCSQGGRCIYRQAKFSNDLQDPSLTYAGLKCGNNKFCVDQKCTKISSLSYLKSCSKACLNAGGVCNNNGNCHCPKGRACPYCELAGPGGSADSGQGCILHDNCDDCFTPLAKGMMVLFLLVLPLLVVAGLCYIKRDLIRNRICGQRHSATEVSSNPGVTDKEISSDAPGQHVHPVSTVTGQFPSSHPIPLQQPHRRPPPPPRPSHLPTAT